MPARGFGQFPEVRRTSELQHESALRYTDLEAEELDRSDDELEQSPFLLL